MSLKRTIFIISGVVSLSVILVLAVYAAVVTKDAPVPTVNEPVPQVTTSESEDLGFGYIKKNNKIYFQDGEVVGADPNTFVALREYCAKDAVRGYYHEHAIPGSDGSTFVCLGYDEAKDKNHVFFGGKVLEGADVATYEVVNTSDLVFSRDKKTVYCSGEAIPGADPKTYRFAGNVEYLMYNSIQFTMDDAAVYTDCERAAFDAKTFSVVGDRYVKDKTGVYFVQYDKTYKKVAGADIATFHVVTDDTGRNTFQDKQYVYYIDQKAALVDGSIKQVYGFYAKSNAAVYYRMNIIAGADPKTFEFVGSFTVGGVEGQEVGDAYMKDKNYVYASGKRLVGADVETFRMTPRVGYAEDKNNKYAFGEKIKDDFISCSTDAKLIPTSIIDQLHTVSGKYELGDVEFCTLKDRRMLIGFEYLHPKQNDYDQSKQYYLFDNQHTFINEKPATILCQGAGVSLGKTIDVLDGSVAKVHCPQPDACAGATIYLLDLDKMKTDPENAFSKSDEYYDCGYRG